ncbi:MAG: glycerol-3-phosphate acyltransferase [Oscillospiraceae bacterium]|nr:glycerol-3-phosphate acyltransferase [Oscillospiraceae bacterium]
MLGRILSIVIGYFFGCLLTAEWIARRYTGQSAAELGETGNPGMANVMASLGFWPGIVTLLGDITKCMVAMTVCYLLFHKAGWIITMYAGLGCTLGHIFPFWRGFRGGKGVATSSTVMIIYSVLWGLLANLAGMLVAFGTKYLCIAGPIIPFFFTLFYVLQGNAEAGILSLLFFLLALYTHGPSISGILTKSTSQTDVLGAVTKYLERK